MNELFIKRMKELLKDDFDACIGYGYKQTRRVEEKFINQEPLKITDKNFAEILLRFLLYVVLFIDNQVYNDVLNFLYLLHFFYSSSLSSVVSRFFCSFVSRIET